ncbi:MAG TPA: hypothetical protein VJT49_18490 [Amycolatopsis sp.]|uniref:hypothetical protein n=1 Tax=Amycolatopsis sp. TaxID=37632 RepID=UPI002B47C273|nr:hypothetical protein [Amycolatopsis sp.]HKS47057.1 hypothetical protein [Amycolatopsis sp.]
MVQAALAGSPPPVFGHLRGIRTAQRHQPAEDIGVFALGGQDPAREFPDHGVRTGRYFALRKRRLADGHTTGVIELLDR